MQMYAMQIVLQSLIGKVQAHGANGKKEKVKIAVPLKYLSNFWRSLKMYLINCKVDLSLTWIENCVLSGEEGVDIAGAVVNAGTAATLEITDAKRYVPVVTLSAEDSVKLIKQLSEEFKRPVYWSKYKVIPNKNEVGKNNEPKRIRELLDSSYQGVKRLFVFAYDNTADNRVTANSYEKYLLPRVNIENYNTGIDGRSFYDQPINDLIKQYDEVRKVSTGQGYDCITGCLLDFAYFEKNYRLIAANLGKQKALDADSRAIQLIIFTGTLKTRAIIYCILEQSKDKTLQFSKGTAKVL